MIAIHRGSEILEIGVNQGSIRRFNLMKEDFIRLKFSLAENKPLLIGDYVDLTDYINSCDNEKFRIKDENTDQTTKLFVLDRNYYPTFNKETGGWDYDVQINAYYHQWKNKIFMFNPSKGAAESSFSLTDTIFTHAALLVNNLKYAEFTYNGTKFNVAYQEEFDGQLQAKGMKPITYSAVSNYAALDLIAQAFECEWWLDGGSTIYFGYRKGNETTELTLNKEIADVSTSDSDGVHATRIFAFGGTTNVPKHYRDKLEFTVDSDGIANGSLDSKHPVYASYFKKKISDKAYSTSVYSLGTPSEYETAEAYTTFDVALLKQSYSGSVDGLKIDYSLPQFDNYNSNGTISFILSADVYLFQRKWGEVSEVVLANETVHRENVEVGNGLSVNGSIEITNVPYEHTINIDTAFIGIRLKVVNITGVFGEQELQADGGNTQIRFDSSEFTVSYRKSAKAAETKIVIGGDEREAVINPNFEDDGTSIKIVGYVPKVGDRYSFPDIIIGKVEGSYFSTEEGGVQTGVVQKNLMIPIEQPKNFEYDGNDSINYAKNYVQAGEVSNDSVVEAIMVYDWIYPKTELTISEEVVPHEMEIDGDEETTKVTTYDITLPIAGYDSSLWVDPSQMFAIFQTGKAAGLRFELDYVSQTEDSVTFRLVPNEDYVTWIPNAETIPAKGDTLILDGIDVTFIDSSVIGKAEEKLLYQALKDIVETSKEDKVVDITLSPDYAYNKGRIALGTLTSLVDVLSSEDNAYDSRILGFEECLDIPWDKPKYIIGDKNYYNRQASIESKLENIEKGSITLNGVNIGGGGSNIPIIKVKDSTKPTDANVYSALRSREEFAKRKEEETFSEKVTFNKDIDVKGTAKAKNLSVSGNANIGGNQTIQGTQEVKGVQTLHQGFKTPNFFQQGDTIQGAQVDADGNAAFTSITAPVMQIYELSYNRKTAVQEEFIFSDGDTIETVTYIQTDGTEIDSTVYNGEEYSYIRLGVRKQYEGYMTTFKDEDILYSNVNIIGESGQPATTGKCWMRVLALDNDLGVEPISSDGLFINALLYSTSQCPAGVNMAPTPHMIISRHGNAGIDEDGKAKYPERQSVFIISTASENMVMLRGISAPIIPQTGAYAIVSGKLPKSLFDEVYSYASYISKDDPVFYARYGIFENMIQLDHEGLPIKTERYRGAWSKAIAEGDEDNRYRSKNATDITYYDTVSYEGSKWACEDDKTEEAPSDSSTKWTKIVSKGDDGTSIKVSGSYNTVKAFEDVWKNADGTWKAPKDESECYVVAGDLYVWVQDDAKWDNVGRFKGDKGDKGDSVTGSTIQYAINQSMTDKPDESEFNDDYPTAINEGDVLWTRTRVNFDNATIKTEWAYSASRQAANGKGINSITTQYSITQDSKQPDITDESLWHDTIEEAGELVPNSYLWTATITDFEDTSKQDEWSITVQRIGADGTSVTAGEPEYQVHNDGVNPPTGKWSTSVPSVGEGQYLWTRMPFIEGSTTTYAYSVSKNGQSVTIDEIKYAKSTTTTQPSDEEFTYDTPPSVGEGEYLWTRTKFGGASNKVIYTYAYQGMDNSAVEFSLQPNVTTIYIHDEDNLSTESINLTVRKATSKGVEIIDNNADLSADGFKLQYTYDGILDDRKDIILNPETILLEDGSEMLLEDDSAAELEFTVEDILNVKNYIEFYLVNVNTNEIWATCTVAVVHDGESLTSLIVTPKTIFVNVGVSGDKNGKIIDPTKEHTIAFQIKKGDKSQLLSDYTIKVSAGGLVLANIKDEDSYTKSFVISCRNGSSIPPAHTITATKGSLTITEEVTIHPVQQGLVGSSGKLYYSMGYWDETTAAEDYYKNDDKRICYIYHVDSFYERTDNPLKTYKDEDGKTRYYTPDVEVATFGSNGGWKVMPKYSAIIADFIMAKFARFGSPNGGVFYSNLLFSAMGLNKAGNQVPYDRYSDDMFVGDDENGHRLNGTVIPNLFLDFLHGSSKFGKLSESFLRVSNDEALHKIDIDTCHNISAAYRELYPCVVTLPSSNTNGDNVWAEDGTHCTIAFDYWHQYTQNPSDDGYKNEIIAVCADDRFFIPESNLDSYSNKLLNMRNESNSWIIWKGRRCKFVLLSAGSMLSLRSLRGENEGDIIWFVENSSDFEELNGKVLLHRNYPNEEAGEIYNDTESMEGGWLGRLIGSPTLNWFKTNPVWNLAANGITDQNDKVVAYLWYN